MNFKGGKEEEKGRYKLCFFCCLRGEKNLPFCSPKLLPKKPGEKRNEKGKKRIIGKIFKNFTKPSEALHFLFFFGLGAAQPFLLYTSCHLASLI